MLQHGDRTADRFVGFSPDSVVVNEYLLLQIFCRRYIVSTNYFFTEEPPQRELFV